jgi:hypothetical protein
MSTTSASGHKLTAQRQSIVTALGIEGAFATKTGGETSAEVTKVYDGGSTTPENLAGPPTTDNVTCGRPYRATRDAAIIKRLRPRVGSFRTTITVQPTDADLIPYGPPTVYADALLVRLAESEVDAASGEPGMIELEFAIETVA